MRMKITTRTNRYGNLSLNERLVTSSFPPLNISSAGQRGQSMKKRGLRQDYRSLGRQRGFGEYVGDVADSHEPLRTPRGVFELQPAGGAGNGDGLRVGT